MSDILLSVGMQKGTVGSSQLEIDIQDVVKRISKNPPKVSVGLKVDPAALNHFKTQLTQIVNSVAVSKGSPITVNISGLGEVSAKATQAGQAFDNMANSARNAANAANEAAGASQKSAQSADAAAKQEAQAENQRHTLLKQSISLITRMQQAEQNWTKAATGKSSADYNNIKEYKAELEMLHQQFVSGTIGPDTFAKHIKQLNTDFATASSNIKAAGENTKSFGERISGLAAKFGTWFSITRVIMLVVQSIKKMVTAVKDIDKAMTELKKVTNETAAAYDRFLKNAASRAKAVGATISDTVNASADFARLGYSLSDSEALADTALIYKNIGDGIKDITEASESIISTMQAFGIEASNSMSIVDKFNKVGNNFAISSAGIGEAMKRSSAAMASANNTIDETIALITAANTIVQNPESVGTTMKTLSMYLRAAKTEAEEAGESTDGMANSVSELRKDILALTGQKVDIQLDENTFKSTYQILKELSVVWDSISDVSQANLLEMIGGKRNANVVSAILENFKVAEEALNTSLKSAGSAMEENAKHLESIEGRMSVLKATFQEMSQSLIGSDFVKDVVDLGTDLLNILLLVGNLIEKLGGLNNVLMVTVGIIATIKANVIAAGIVKISSGIMGIAPAIVDFCSKLKLLPLAMQVAAQQGKGLSAALNAVGISATTSQIAVAALVAVLSIAIISLNEYNRRVKQTIQDNIDKGKSAKEEADNLKNLINQYKSLSDAENRDADTIDQIRSIQEQITKLVGGQADNLDLVNGKLDEEIKKLDEIALKTAENNTGRLLVAKDSATDKLVASSWGGGSNSWDEASALIEYGSGANKYNMLKQAMTEIGLADEYLYNKGFYVHHTATDPSETDVDVVLQSYSDLLKLQEHLVANYNDEISRGGKLNKFYSGLSERINTMSSAIDEYNTAISNYNQNEAVKDLGNYLKTNDIDSKEDFDAYINSVKGSSEYSEAYKQVLIDLATQTFPQYSDAITHTTEATDGATKATNKFVSAISQINTLKSGLDKLDAIYADIYDKGDFDYSSLVNEEFANTFGGLGAAYDEFVETVANSPDDIDACKDAFNKLVSAYINGSGALDGVTDETRDATVAMLEQMGVANAAEIVDRKLAYQKEYLKYETENLKDATYREIVALYDECEAGSMAQQALAELAIAKFIANENSIYTSHDIAQLKALAMSAGATAESLLLFNEIEQLLASSMEHANAASTESANHNFGNAEQLRKQANEELQKAKDLMSQISYTFTQFDYTGGDETDGVRGNKAETWFEKQLEEHRHLVAMEQETQEEYLEWLSKAYPKAYKEGIISLKDFNKYQEEVFKGNRDLFEDHLGDVEHEISMRENYDGEESTIIALYEGLMSDVEKEIAAARAQGLDDTSEYIQGLLDKWQGYKNSIQDIQDDIADSAKDALDSMIDYRVDMLKQDIQNEKDALDEKRELLRKFYDDQKEMLQDQHDEEEYLKDQAEKRKTVTDIQAEIAMLANDDSAWAQKRKLELQEELNKAQEDLNEFEDDHALELALDTLDEQLNNQETQLDAEMKALDAKLNDPNALFNKALDDIRHNSENQLYYQMLEYNRKYGDGNDETVNELWESTFGALSDYEKLFGKLYNGVSLDNPTGVKPGAGYDDQKPKTDPTPPSGPKDGGGTTGDDKPSLEIGSSIQVKDSATHYGSKSGSVRMASFVPGGTYKVEGVSGDQVKISKNGSIYGWINKSDIVGYKSGSNYTAAGLAMFDEAGAGSEYIFESADGNRYRMFAEGSKVLNANATDFLYNFATTGGNFLTKMLSDLLGLSGINAINKPIQAIEINAGDVIVQGRADTKTVSEIRRAQRDNLEFVLKELNKLNK